MNNQVHNESLGVLQELKYDNYNCFSLQMQNLQELTDIKFISALYLFGDTLYIGTRSSKFYIYTLVKGGHGSKLIDERILVPHCETVSYICANQHFFITVPESDDEASVTIWNVKNLLFEVSLKGHQSQVSKVMFLENADLIATSSWDNSVCVWSLKKKGEHGDLLIAKTQCEYPVLVVEQVSRAVLAFGGDDCYINIWNYQRNQILGKVFGHAGSVTFLLMEKGLLMSAGGDSRIRIWKLLIDEKEQDKMVEEEMIESEHGKEALQLVKKQEMKKQIEGSDGQEDPDSSEQQYINYEIGEMQSEFKMDYDATVYMCEMPKQNKKFFIDRRGNSFVFANNLVLEGENQFEYGLNVTGVVCYGETLFISTTKGELRQCHIIGKKMPPPI